MMLFLGATGEQEKTAKGGEQTVELYLRDSLLFCSATQSQRDTLAFCSAAKRNLSNRRLTVKLHFCIRTKTSGPVIVRLLF